LDAHAVLDLQGSRGCAGALGMGWLTISKSNTLGTLHEHDGEVKVGMAAYLGVK
jgi:hypothetical protein